MFRDMERARPEQKGRPPLQTERANSSSSQDFSEAVVPPRLTGLGMRLERREGSRVIIVEEIIPGFAADLSGQVTVGDIVE